MPMLRPPKVISGAVLLAVLLCALVLGGCGGGSTATRKNVATIAFTSPAISATKKKIPVRYTCDGRNISPPLEWGAVPANVTKLALFVIGFTPELATKTLAVSVNWAVAGLNPALHRLLPGRVPPGAYVGLSTDKQRRYSICPVRGKTVEYAFELYGLPSTVSVSQNFPSLSVLNSLVHRGSTTFTNAHGAFAAAYKRL
jgi:phosphatidylethanolamine-binding protein (PEBP) family uncharacterized protein